MLRICHKTDIGVERESNEDAWLAVEFEGFKDSYLLAVADGMGGHNAGEVASNMCITVIKKEITKFAGPRRLFHQNATNFISKAIERANSEIYRMAKNNPEYAGMGTTLVLALIIYDKAIIANVGDSRAYMTSKSGIRRITKDHSYVQALVESGSISEEEAFGHPQKNVITRVVGYEEQVEADIFEETIEEGSALLLCSDGLTDALNDEEIGEVVAKAVDCDEACRRLVSLANERGGRDNITVILAKG